MNFNEQFIIDAGWYVYERCDCGTLQYKYMHMERPGYMVKVYVNKNGFDLVKENRVIARGTFENLQNEINEIGVTIWL